DGRDDIITGAGAGGGPHVKIFSGSGLVVGVVPALIQQFFAYEPGFAGGVFVAAGDVGGDGQADVITGPGGGGGPLVRVFSGTSGGTILPEFFAYESSFRGGARVGAADVNGDGKDDILTGPGVSGGPLFRAFSGADGTTMLENGFVFDPAS